MERKIGRYWYYYGRKSGFGIGFNISKYSIELDLGLWYLAVEL